MKRRMVFDVESIGLHGEGFAVGYVILEGEDAVSEGWALCSPLDARGTQEGRTWIRINCPWLKPESLGEELPGYPQAAVLSSPQNLRDWFWRLWLDERHKGTELWADVAWPVEARFLIQCVEDAKGFRKNVLMWGVESSREWDGPYPLYDVSTLVPVNGRPSVEGMEHHPLADARRSAKLLLEHFAKAAQA